MKSISDDSAGGTRSELALSRGWPVIISHFSLWEGSLLVCILTGVWTQSASNERSGQSPLLRNWRAGRRFDARDPIPALAAWRSWPRSL
jgi:hypothetical protein